MNTAEKPSVVILIVNWNNYQDTKNCLISLDQITYANYSVWIIDNGSEDDSLDRLRAEFPELFFLSLKRNFGFAGGNNAGIQQAIEKGFDFILLLNNDTEVIRGDFLQDLVEEMENSSEIGAVGPLVLKPDGSTEITILPYPKLWVTIFNTLGMYHKDPTKRQLADSLTGCCVLVRVDAIRDAGLLDQNYFMYAEETEWFYRIRKKGWIVLYLPVISVFHCGGATSKQLVSSQVYIERRANVIYTLVKHQQTFQAFLTGMFMFGLLGLRLLFQFISPEKGTQDDYSASMLGDLLNEFSKKWKLGIKARSPKGNTHS